MNRKNYYQHKTGHYNFPYQNTLAETICLFVLSQYFIKISKAIVKLNWAYNTKKCVGTFKDVAFHYQLASSH